jgi:teichuronic acid biosynthesis glycosyltransferase TuaC
VHTVVVTTSFPAHAQDPSGHFVREDALTLVRLGHKVTVLAPATVTQQRHDHGLHVQWLTGGDAFGWPGAAARVRQDKTRVVGVAGFLLRASRALASLRPTRVVSHWVLPCAWPVRIPADADLQLVSHGADIRLLRGLPSPVASALAYRLAQRASRWRIVSASLADALLSHLGSESRQAVRRVLEIAPSAVCTPRPDPALVQRLRAALPDGPALAVVGRLTAQKRVDHILTQVAQGSPRRHVVVLGDGPERPRLEALAQSLGLNAQFLGTVRRDEALAWMQACEALGFAAQNEGNPTVLREAQTLGVQVIRWDNEPIARIDAAQ